MKKVLIQNTEQLEMVREEIRVSSLFSHPNLLPLLDHAIIPVKVIAASTLSLWVCTWNGRAALLSNHSDYLLVIGLQTIRL